MNKLIPRAPEKKMIQSVDWLQEKRKFREEDGNSNRKFGILDYDKIPS
jgi:hypothetical protein